jgi:hypothetical protein
MKIAFRFFILIFILSCNIFAQFREPENAKGLFLTVGVGPRFPIGLFGEQQTIGSGFDIMLSYTDSELAPIFFYANVGYQNHSGNYNYYKKSDISSLSTNIISLHSGGRYFFKPIIEDLILLMPIIEGGVTYAHIEKFNKYIIDLNKNDDLQSLSQFGFHIGGGLSFFLMDIVAIYNYLQNNQYFSVNVRLTLPLAITL